MATQAQLDQFNQLVASGNYAAAGQLAASAGYSAADVAAYLGAPVEAVAPYVPQVTTAPDTGMMTQSSTPAPATVPTSFTQGMILAPNQFEALKGDAYKAYESSAFGDRGLTGLSSQYYTPGHMYLPKPSAQYPNAAEIVNYTLQDDGTYAVTGTEFTNDWKQYEKKLEDKFSWQASLGDIMKGAGIVLGAGGLNNFFTSGNVLGTTGGLDKGLFSGLGDTTADIWAQTLVDAGMPLDQAVAMGTELAASGVPLSQASSVISYLPNATGGSLVGPPTGTVLPPGSGAGGAITSPVGSGGVSVGTGIPPVGAGGGAGAGGAVTGTPTAPFDITNPATYPWGSIASTGVGLLGGYLNTQAAKDAAEAQAKAQIDAAKIAADAAKFRPVGVKTAFGQSQFGFDPTTGYLTSAGYTLSPELAAQRDKLMGMSGGMLDQANTIMGNVSPIFDAATRAGQLGNQYLMTSPQEQAAKYMAEQNALLRPGNQAELANLQNKLAAQGRLGLAVGGEDGLMATNPEMAAYQNKLEMQQRQLAAASTQGGMDYARFGAGLVGTGTDLARSGLGLQTAALDPYKATLNQAVYNEGLGQNAMNLGMSLGSTATAANANAGNLLSQGMMSAANTTGAVNQAAGSTWGNLLQGAGSALQNYQTQQQQQAQQAQQQAYQQAMLAKIWGT